MKRFGVFLPPNGWDTSTHVYTWVKRDTVRVKCLAQEPNTMYLAGLEPRPLDQSINQSINQSRDKRTNHEASNASNARCIKTKAKQQ